MAASSVVTISDVSRSLQALEKTAGEIDLQISEISLEIAKLEKKKANLITQRDSLLGASDQFREYRKMLASNP